ncbi:hypothetical protein RBE51_20050 [Pseudomonas taiwanensis]|uniref:hypothetical protein n=1 Tax=Pseudomonas taiwanensis TaxID=470150 RepID=UPI0028DF2980|nr:hypothetical protein [Pseudomonas taiwanensis]MDT8925086.1 hypothetical protein [Pseudomonas taiwanensis]
MNNPSGKKRAGRFVTGLLLAGGCFTLMAGVNYVIFGLMPKAIEAERQILKLVTTPHDTNKDQVNVKQASF